MVCATVKLRLRKDLEQKGNIGVKYDTSKLMEENVRNTFSVKLRNRFQAMEQEDEEKRGEEVADAKEEVERVFAIMKKACLEVAETVLGKPRKKNKPWISGESWSLIDERQQMNKKILSARSERVKGQLRNKYREKDREVKRRLKADKKKWLEEIATEAEEAARSQHMKTLYGLTRKLCNERPGHSTAVLDKDSNLLSKKEDIQERWTEHFKEVLNRGQPDNPIGPEDEVEFEFGELIEEISVNEPTFGVVKDAITRLKNGKSPSIDNITSELLKADPEFSAKRVHELLVKV